MSLTGCLCFLIFIQLNERLKGEDVKSVPFISVPVETGITYQGKKTNLNPQGKGFLLFSQKISKAILTI